MENDPHISDLLIAALTPPPSPRNPPHADRSLSGAYAAAPAVLQSATLTSDQTSVSPRTI